MRTRIDLSAWFAWLHLALAVAHAVTHQQLAIHGSLTHSAIVLLVVYLGPLASLALLRRHRREATAWLWGFLAGSLVFASYHHFVLISPDHVGHLPSSEWALPFQISAVLMSLVDAVGVVVLGRGLARHSELLAGGRHVILVDGECVFCNRLVATILSHDRAHVFHFAQIQSDFGRAVLRRHGRYPDDVDPVYMLANAGSAEEKLLTDGEVGQEVWPRLFKLAWPARLVPLTLLNASYACFAAVRYRLFGRYDQCYVPSQAERERYVS